MSFKKIKDSVAKSKIGSLIRPGYAQVSQRIRMMRNAHYDAKRFMRWSFTVRRPLSCEQLRSSIVMTYHSLEKGMALPEPRPGFGQDKTHALIKMMREYARRFEADHYFATSVNVLRKYHLFNQKLEKDLPWVNVRLKNSLSK